MCVCMHACARACVCVCVCVCVCMSVSLYVSQENDYVSEAHRQRQRGSIINNSKLLNMLKIKLSPSSHSSFIPSVGASCTTVSATRVLFRHVIFLSAMRKMNDSYLTSLRPLLRFHCLLFYVRLRRGTTCHALTASLAC